VSEPAELLALAEKLLTGTTSDVETATSVSRAYYAAYGWALQFHNALALKGTCFAKNAGVHQELIQQLENPNNALDAELAHTSRYIATQMKIAKVLREAADYNKGPKPVAADAEQAIAIAKDIKDEVARGLRRVAKLGRLVGG
jgi:hypothetical protein